MPDAQRNEMGATYSEEWFRERAGYRGPYQRFAEAIHEIWQPQGVLDVGCGAGYLVEWFAGRCPAVGVDGSPAARLLQPLRARRHCLLLDLVADAPPPRALEMPFAVSIEVAEHIAERHVQRFLDWFSGARQVLLTAAPPGQGGLHHVNEQPVSYWRGAMAARGFRFEAEETRRWQKAARQRTAGCPWVVRNAMLFRREDSV